MKDAFLSWFPYATDGCSAHRSPSIVAPRSTWRPTSPETPSTGIRVQACGDAHLCNFGAFATPERRAVFDINDLDETLPAPWEWDVKRLAASIVVASRSNGFSDDDARDAAAGMCPVVSRAHGGIQRDEDP